MWVRTASSSQAPDSCCPFVVFSSPLTGMDVLLPPESFSPDKLLLISASLLTDFTGMSVPDDTADRDDDAPHPVNNTAIPRSNAIVFFFMISPPFCFYSYRIRTFTVTIRKPMKIRCADGICSHRNHILTVSSASDSACSG